MDEWSIRLYQILSKQFSSNQPKSQGFWFKKVTDRICVFADDGMITVFKNHVKVISDELWLYWILLAYLRTSHLQISDLYDQDKPRPEMKIKANLRPRTLSMRTLNIILIISSYILNCLDIIFDHQELLILLPQKFWSWARFCEFLTSDCNTVYIS